MLPSSPRLLLPLLFSAIGAIAAIISQRIRREIAEVAKLTRLSQQRTEVITRRRVRLVVRSHEQEASVNRLLNVVRTSRLAVLHFQLVRDAIRSLPSERDPGSEGSALLPSSWHAVAPDGSCPARIPQWDWHHLLTAATATDALSREANLAALRLTSGLPLDELQAWHGLLITESQQDLSQRYKAVLENPEFQGLLDTAHPPCDGRQFAQLLGDRMLHIDCPQGAARYTVDDFSDMAEYIAPVKVDHESVLAFCDDEFNLLLHPRLRPKLVQIDAARPSTLPSVLVIMLDATSRAHFRRSMPKTLRVLERLSSGAPTAEEAARARNRGGRAAADGWSGVHAFDFEHFNIVGYNSLPNQLPLFCASAPEDVNRIYPGQCIWEIFKQHGAVTMMLDEVHDRCVSPTSVLHAIDQEAFYMSQSNKPDHELWRLFCSPHVKPCCWAKGGFLNPGRRQCVGGGKELHQVTLGYLEEWLSMYASAPRRWASLNTMVAHEHFMLRLPSLDETLAALLERLARTAMRDTVIFMLSDHGTHGIWYNDYEIGAAEHKLPMLYVLVPAVFLHERPEWHEALEQNTKKMVTAYELYHAMRQLALWPAQKEKTEPLSIFDHLKSDRSCKEAGIPEEFCACRRNGWYEDHSLGD